MIIDAKDRDRFEAKINRNGPVPTHCPELGPCHVWTACCGSGYGQFRFKGRLHKSHRFAFFLAHGRWPEPCALHRCDNTACVNDAHLFEGTNADNSGDMVAKGRSARGERSGRHTKPERTARGDRNGAHTQPHRRPRGERQGSAKLTEQDVRDIRANYALCRVTQPELAARFAVGLDAISRILRGKTWTHCLSGAEET